MGRALSASFSATLTFFLPARPASKPLLQDGSQRDKIAQELKRELKKLQRLREQVGPCICWCVAQSQRCPAAARSLSAARSPHPLALPSRLAHTQRQPASAPTATATVQCTMSLRAGAGLGHGHQ